MSLIQGKTLTLLKLHLKSLHIFGALPYYIEPLSGHLKYTNHFWKEKLKNVLLFLFFVLVSIQIYQGRNKFSTAVTLETMVYAGACVTFVASNFIVVTKADSICQLFNILQNAQNNLNDSSTNSKLTNARPVHLFQLCACLTAPVSIFSHCLRMWWLPCNPIFPGYFLLSQCSNVFHFNTYILDNQVSLAFRTATCILKFVMLIATTGSYCLIAMQLLCVQIFCLRGFLKQIKGVINVRMFNTVDQRNFRQVDLGQVYRMHRQIQILVQFYNDINQSVITPVLMTYSVYAVVLSMYALIKRDADESSLQIVILLLVAVDGIIVLLLCFGTMGKLFLDSVAVKTFLATKLVPLQKTRTVSFRLTKAYCKSMKPLAVHIGSVNFVDELTTLNVLNFLFNTLATLLLLK